MRIKTLPANGFSRLYPTLEAFLGALMILFACSDYVLASPSSNPVNIFAPRDILASFSDYHEVTGDPFIAALSCEQRTGYKISRKK